MEIIVDPVNLRREHSIYGVPFSHVSMFAFSRHSFYFSVPAFRHTADHSAYAAYST